IAGLAGVLYSYNGGGVDPSEFALLAGLGVVAYAYLGGITTVTGAAIGGVLAPAGLLSYVGSNYISLPVDYQLFLYGLAVVFAIAFTPQGAALKLQTLLSACTGPWGRKEVVSTKHALSAVSPRPGASAPVRR